MEITRNILWFVSLFLILATTALAESEDGLLTLKEKKKLMKKDI